MTEKLELKPNQPDPTSFTDFERETMWNTVMRYVETARTIKKAHAARGIFHELGPDGKYHPVTRKPE